MFRPGDWYERLTKPSWRPPNQLFAPVWSVLYLMIAVSGWLIWRETGFVGATLPLAIYALQLVLSAAWTPLFFGLHRIDLGFFDIVLVWLSIVATIVLFLSYPLGRSHAASTLPRVGHVCCRAQLRRLAPQSFGEVAKLKHCGRLGFCR
jgi:translocator protein